MAGLGRVAPAALGILTYKNRYKLKSGSQAFELLPGRTESRGGQRP
jgi:hypothetical protein